MKRQFEKYIYVDTFDAKSDQLLNASCDGYIFSNNVENNVPLIQKLYDQMLPIYDKTSFEAGFVCLPFESIQPEKINRPNVMISLAASESGLQTGYDLLFKGISIHFKAYSLSHYEKVMKLYLRAIEDRDIHYKPLAQVNSMVSFDVAAIDKKVNDKLNALHEKPVGDLRNKAAIALVQLARLKFERYFSGDSWSWLAEHGAKPQRLLFDVCGATEPHAYINTLYGQIDRICLSVVQFEGGILDHSAEKVDSFQAGAVLRDLGLLGIHLDELGDSFVE